MKALQEPFPYFMPSSSWIPPQNYPIIQGCKRIAIDRETKDEDLQELGPGTRRSGNYVVGTAIGTDRGERVYLPVRHEGGGNLDLDKVRRWEREVLNEFDGEIVGAHLLYDLEWYAIEGVTFPNVKRFLDIQVAEPILDEFRFSYDLDSISKDYLGEGKEEVLLRDAAFQYGWKTNRQIKKNLWRLPASLVGPYAEGDVDRPLRILELQEKKLEEEDLSHIFDLESQLIPALLAQRLRGVRVDLARAEQIYRELARERSEHEARARAIAGTQKIELRKLNSLANALEERGFTLPRTKPSKTYPDGQRSVTKTWLAANANDPLVREVAEYRKVDKILTTYVGPILENHVRGRIYGQFHQLRSNEDVDEEGKQEGAVGTITSRFSSSKPNLQQLPARDKRLGPLTRSIYTPEEGELWLKPDLCLTGDTRIITIDGYIKIKDLVLHPVPVLSSPDAKTLEFKAVTRAAFIGVKPVYKIFLKDGSSVKCTAEHNWIDYHNNKIRTDALQAGTRLAHVKMSSEQSYPTWWMRSYFNYVSCHRLTALYELGPVPPGYEVDHKDHDSRNWTRNNLQHLSIRINRGQGAKSYWARANEEQKQEKIRHLIQGQKDNRRSYVGEGNPNSGKKHPGVGGRPFLGNILTCLICGKQFKAQRQRIRAQFCSVQCRSSSRIKRANKFVEDTYTLIKPLIDLGSSYSTIANKLNENKVPTSSGTGKWSSATISGIIRRQIKHNHYVVKVEYIGEEPVYNITVADNHTFVLANGLLSSNSQIEYRYLVNFAVGAGAEEAREAYRQDPNTDFHVMAGDTLGADATDEFIRKRVKNTNFCKVYGGGDEKLAETFGCSVEEARAFNQRYSVKLPFVDYTRKKCSEWADRRGFVVTILNRKMRFPFWEPRWGRGRALLRDKALIEYGIKIKRAKTKDGLSRKLQGSASEQLKMWMVKAHEAGLFAVDALGAFLVTVHDELGCSQPQTPRGYEAAKELKRVAETCIEGLRVPIIAKVESGPNWGHCK